MKKILAIAWKEVYVRFTDRNLVLLMVVTPIVLSTIIGLAFSRIGNSDVPVGNIPLAIVNLDEGGELDIKFGDIFLSALIPGSEQEGVSSDLTECGTFFGNDGQSNGDIFGEATLLDLTEATSFDAEVANQLIQSGEIDVPAEETGSPKFIESAARKAVDAEIYDVAIIIPTDFTEKVTLLSDQNATATETGVLVYADAAHPISGGIIHSIASGITNQIVAGNISLAASFSELFELGVSTAPGSSTELPDFSTLAACAFQVGGQTITLAVEEVEESSSENVTLALFVRFGSAQAMFFGLFTAGFGVLSMYDERRNWTLQRLIISPTPRTSIMTGKLIGIFLAVLFQITLLLIAMTSVASIVVQEPTSIWGDDLIRVIIVTLAAASAVTGFGMFITGIARTPEQGQIFNTVFAIGLAVLGGSFGFILPPEISRFSLIYWGRTAFETLSFTGGEVALNVAVLIAQGAIFFLIGLYFFNRRFDITG